MWNVLTTEPRREASVAAGLIGRGVTVYLPLYRERVRAAPNTAAQFRVVDKPLFPGYLFAKMQGDAWNAARRVAGYAGYLRSGDAPATLSEAAIDAVRRLEADLATRAPCESLFRPGDAVRITDDNSPWCGIEATVRGLDKRDYVIISHISGKRIRVPAFSLEPRLASSTA